MIENQQIQKEMLYATLNKFPTPLRSKPTCIPENIGYNQDCTSILSKKISTYANRGLNKHGRKFVIKQQRSSQHRPKPQNKSRQTAYDSKWNRNDNQRVNSTVHEQPKHKTGGKRHTYNYPYQSSEREADYQQKPSREEKTRAKRSCITSHSGNNYETQKKWMTADSQHERRESCLKSEDLDEESQFLESKAHLHRRKASVLAKLTPLQLSNQRMVKPSLVELIKKFKFQNLKTTQSNSRDFYPIEDGSDHVKTPVSPVFFLKERREKTDQEDPLYAYRLTNRKFNKTITKNIAKDRKTEGIPYNNSILTPWVTAIDNFSNTQNLIE